jgi:hypothetical protein
VTTVADCICRVDRDGKRWTNAACREHGVPSSADDPLTVSEQKERDRG